MDSVRFGSGSGPKSGESETLTARDPTGLLTAAANLSRVARGEVTGSQRVEMVGEAWQFIADKLAQYQEAADALRPALVPFRHFSDEDPDGATEA